MVKNCKTENYIKHSENYVTNLPYCNLYLQWFLEKMIKKIAYITLSIFVLVATMGITLNMHYCRGDLYSVALYTEATNCCSDVNHHHNLSKHHHCTTEKENKNACDNHSVTFKTTSDFTNSVQNIDFETYNFVILNTNALFDESISIESNNYTNFLNFSDLPPNPWQILTFLQSFQL